MQVLHTPIRCAQFQWRPPQPQPSGQPLKIIGLGRLAEKKGFLDSLHVIAALVRSGRAVHFDLYGEGVQRQELERLAQQLGIVDKVAFHGPVAHDVAIAAFSKAHLFLSTNRVASNGDCEGIPNTIKEAMAIGLPVLPRVIAVPRSLSWMVNTDCWQMKVMSPHWPMPVRDLLMITHWHYAVPWQPANGLKHNLTKLSSMIVWLTCCSHRLIAPDQVRPHVWNSRHPGSNR